jgi:hypothetical protein
MESNPPAPPPPGGTPPPPGGTPPPPPGGTPPPPASAGGSSSDLIPPAQPPKDPILILVLNLILLCVGYFIIGQWQKGLVAIAAALVLMIGTCFIATPAVPLIAIFTAIDGYMQAEQLKSGHSVRQWTFFQNHV